MAPLRQFWEELVAGPADNLATYATFLLHLTPADVVELDRQLLEVVDRWVLSDADRKADLQATPHRGAFPALRPLGLTPADRDLPASDLGA